MVSVASVPFPSKIFFNHPNIFRRYDNEMGYSNRVIDLIAYMQTKD